MKLRFILRSCWRSLKFKYLPLLFLASFITVLLAGNPIGAIAPWVVPKAIAQQPSQEIRGVWMTNNDTEILVDHPKLQEAVRQLGLLNFNTIYPVVWNSGYVLHESAVAQRIGIQPFVRKGLQGQDIFTDLVTQAHYRGLLVIPWFEFGFMAPPTSELVLNHPDWITQRRDRSQTWIGAAGEVVWLNPFHPEVQQFITDLVLEVVTQYPVDGIQFDDHTSLPNEFGYDSYTIALYKQETKKDVPPNPQDPEWVRWRADKITAFMTQLNHAVKKRKPKAIFSISPNPYVTAYNTYLQDWLTWVRQGIVDELIVQVYRPNLQSFREQLARPEIQEAQQKIPTGVGVLTGLRNKPVSMQLIQAKVQAARDRGLGVAFFYYESLWDNSPEPITERQSNFQSLFHFPAFRSAIK
ncbi:MAG TPA: glycoside hydrolase family 10 protein [Leptolyngbyaceae cyanobacterium]